jgi:hypothetical protein
VVLLQARRSLTDTASPAPGDWFARRSPGDTLTEVQRAGRWFAKVDLPS